MLAVVGGITSYKEAEEVAKSATLKMSQFVLDSLEKKYRKQGTAGVIYQKEQDYFSQLVEETFYNLMVRPVMYKSIK